MTPSDYFRLSLLTSPAHTTPEEWLQHSALGLVTEIGEFTDSIKRHMIYGKPLDLDNLHEELGDIQWYLPLALRGYDLPLAPMEPHAPVYSGATFFDFVRSLYVWAQPIVAAASVKDEIPPDAILNSIAGILGIIDNLICPYFAFSPGEVREANIEKLRKRYPAGFTPAAALARADKEPGQ